MANESVILQRPAAAPSRLAGLMADGDLPAPRSSEPRIDARVGSISVVIPAKDEAGALGPTLAELTEVLAELRTPHEIIVVDDGSADDTGSIAAEHGARVIRHATALGNGAAVKRGFREARCEWILLLDADGQHPPAAIPWLVAAAERHDMVVGSRGGRGGSWYRNAANRVYSGLASYVSSRQIPDLTSGFRLVRADIAKSLVYLLPNTFSYPTTITMSMLRSGYSVGFVPFEVRTRTGRKSHIRLLQDGSRFVLIILRIATFFAPLRVFLPLSLAMAALGVGWYLYTYLTGGRFTNMAALLLTQASVIFALGLVSEQVAALRYARLEQQKERE